MCRLAVDARDDATDLAVLERSEPSRLRGGVLLEVGPR
jgi:hypothetical protein